MKKKYAKAMSILTEAVRGERMKASIGGSGSLAESYCTRIANELQAAVTLLESYDEEDKDESEQ